jgi:GDP-L-fucose synthase
MTKRMLNVGLLSLHRQFGLKYLYLIPSTLYGPGYHTDGRQMHFIFDLIRKILRGKYYNEPVILWGDGYQKRELVYIDDFVDLTFELAGKCENEVINIGAGYEYTIRHFSDLICKIVDYDSANIQFDTNKYVGATSKCLSIKKLNTLILDRSPTNLEQGLVKTIAWFLSNRDTVLANIPIHP